MSSGRATQEEVYDLFHFVALSGDEGRTWVDYYRLTRSNELKLLSDRSLDLLRRRQLRDAREILDQVEGRLQRLDAASLRHVLGRWYYGTLAYYYYCMDDLDRAGEILTLANKSVISSIEQKSFLVSLATHCMDIRLQHARVSRSQMRWREMVYHLEAVKGMAEGILPFCTLTNGTPIDLAAVRNFYDSIPLNEKERDSLNAFLDDDLRCTYFSQHIKRVCVIPGFVLPYPRRYRVGES